MKVLKYGKIQPNKVLCPNCESLLEYTDTDLDYTSLLCHFDEEKIGLKCPVCSRIMLLEWCKDGYRYVRKEDGQLHLEDIYDEAI